MRVLTHVLPCGAQTTAPRTCATTALPRTARPTTTLTTHAHTPALAARSRPKRNIKTAMNNEIMLYGIAQKVCGGAITNQAQPPAPP